MKSGLSGDGFLAEVCQELRKHFQIRHATIQIEVGDADHVCALEHNSYTTNIDRLSC